MKKSLVFATFLMFVASVVLGGLGFKPFDFDKPEICTLAGEVGTENSNFTNLIVFCKFAGEEEFINDDCGGVPLKQITENNYSLADFSVKDYYEKVSAGKVKMQSLYLFERSGESITLKNSRGYYSEYDENSNPVGYTSAELSTRRAELQKDWADAINTAISNGATLSDVGGTKSYDFSELDKNGDGRIDSLTIIYKYSTKFSTSWSAVLWNYQSEYTGVEIETNGKTITSGNYVLMSANYSGVCTDNNGVKFSSLKTAIHEMGHTFGLKDLYKSESNSRVYYMSSMAVALSPIPQFMSAKEREALGWLESEHIKTITTSGSFTIGVTTSDIPQGVICYKINIKSINRTLYLEYRKFDGDQNKYDSQNKDVLDSLGGTLKGITALKSGLVCFLVDNDVLFPDNLHNTGWQYEVLGGTQSTKVDSARNVEDESLLVTTNLEIKVTEMTDDSLTFTISGTDISAEHSHNLTKVEKVNPTCMAVGNIEYYTCSECHKYFLDSLGQNEIELKDTTLEKLPHNLTKVEKVNPTCTTVGNIEYYTCSECNKYFSDSLGQNEITLKSTELSKVPHTESGWIVDTPATPTQNGHKHTECTECGTPINSETIYWVDGGTETPDTGGEGDGGTETPDTGGEGDGETKPPSGGSGESSGGNSSSDGTSSGGNSSGDGTSSGGNSGGNDNSSGESGNNGSLSGGESGNGGNSSNGGTSNNGTSSGTETPNSGGISGSDSGGTENNKSNKNEENSKDNASNSGSSGIFANWETNEIIVAITSIATTIALIVGLIIYKFRKIKKR